jgi:hypothetical protein
LLTFTLQQKLSPTFAAAMLSIGPKTETLLPVRLTAPAASTLLASAPLKPSWYTGFEKLCGSSSTDCHHAAARWLKAVITPCRSKFKQVATAAVTSLQGSSM